ncbi:hypothetical protein BAE44_0001415 [Dichanthelium oligosanthes]|uniref:Uncharacterized protein n=1 Tax=Dichanthelium oligosanthes TaxID=888268 RepID=A0A1E5WJQ3_9POAL|nr:hypothetical protein BAE44_0001415 [Dichanthelium oligosanthes]
MATNKSKQLGEIMWEHRLQAAAAVAFLAAAAVSISAVGPRLGAVVTFFWPLLVSTGFFLVAVAVLLRISPPPAGADEAGKDLVDFVAGCRPEHLVPEAPAVASSVGVPPEPEI